MATADTAAPARADWAPANPWTWAVTGLAASGLALLWVRTLGETLSGIRLLLVLVGLLSAAAAVLLRLRASGGAFLDGLAPARRARALLLLAAAGAALALAASGLLIAALLDVDLPWDLPDVLWVWALAAPAGAAVAFFCLRWARTGRPVPAAAESALVLLAASATAFLGCWALYVDEANAAAWDSARLFLAVLAAVAFLAAPVVLLPRRARRVTFAALVLFHFGGIATAALSPAPAPWIMNQLYGRVYRPYLEFLFLTNAYHFYAPNPGPSSYLWARVEYVNGRGEHHWRWFKTPALDESGRPAYFTALAYQRRIALLDNARGLDPAPPPTINDRNGRTALHPVYFWRYVNSPTPPEPLLGRPAPRPTLIVPTHPEKPWSQQYMPLSNFGKLMVSAYAEHILSLKDPDFPEDRAVRARIYRVIHLVLDPGPLENIDPASPTTFLPYYQGEFDPAGRLLDEPQYDADGNLVKGDPLLYWLIPVLKDPEGRPWREDAAIQSWVRLHAGERRWYRPEGSAEWVERPNPYDRPQPTQPFSK